MEEERKQFYLKLLRSEISPALGCTEPAAAALEKNLLEIKDCK